MTVKDITTGIDYKGVFSIDHDGNLIVLRSLSNNCVLSAYLNDELVFRCEKIILTKSNPELQIYNWEDVNIEENNTRRSKKKHKQEDKDEQSNDIRN